MVKAGILGCAGRMGRANIQAALESRDVEIAALWETQDSGVVGSSYKEFGIAKDGRVVVFPEGLSGVDVVVDFTSPASSLSALKAAVQAGKAMVIGTTGFDSKAKAEIEAASSEIPIVFAPNMSLGVNLLFSLLEKAVKALPREYEIEIVEAHHHNKKDSPSGTAMRLWEVMKGVRGLSDKDLACGRQGITGPRRPDEVGMHSIRCADIVGEHTVIMAVEGERIELTHKASSRLAFAKGAIKAALFIAQKDKGLYNMKDVLGLS